MANPVCELWGLVCYILLFSYQFVTIASDPPRIPDGCFSEGEIISVGETRFVPPCQLCTCDEGSDGPSLWCMEAADCQVPVCIDPEHNGCCWECKNGMSCYAPWGEVIYGEMQVANETERKLCWCEQEDGFNHGEEPDPPQAKCADVQQPEQENDQTI